jgi:hypothetical protein
MEIWVKLIDFKDYPALLISNDDNLQSSPIGFGPCIWVLALLQAIIKKDKKIRLQWK